ncbi:MAG TPA: aldo/keto reductase [Solirubrobacteraceae bacterium]|jgi:aryl-alcohol dehydrogenase-like predicted oxidoreductase/predicted kinase
MASVSWLDASELRIGLGCMRLPADERLALDTIVAAATAGVTVFDTAHAYGATGAGSGDSERFVASALRAAGRRQGARIVTKGGMTRPGGAWVPDGRAKTIAADCEASLVALDGMPIDLYLIHAPDPRTPWRTSVRALARLVEGGMVKRVGLANVTRTQLDEALELAPIAAVQVALSPFDDGPLRGGVVARCSELGITLIAHSPLGGPRRAGRLNRRLELTQVAARNDATPAEAALVWLLGLSPVVVAIPGARRPESARSAARAGTLELGTEDRAVLKRAFGGVHRPARGPSRNGSGQPSAQGEIVIVMGIPGAGKSRVAASYVERGYARLNRDERGGSLRALAGELDDLLAAGVRCAVLDNTYLTRAARSRVVETAERHSLAVRCVWLDTPLAQAQINLVERLLERFSSLPTPEQIRAAARREPWLMLPTSQMRALRELEPPSMDEGFTSLERVPFARVSVPGGRSGVFVGAAATARRGIVQALADADPAAPHLLFDWRANGDADTLLVDAARISKTVTGPVDVAVCPHPAGPPSCWCRPPLQGLPLAFARAHSIDPACSILVGCSPAHRTLATSLGARYIPV